MLESIRNFSSTWVAKIILGLIVLSLGVFGGISEITRNIGIKNYKAIVGGDTISIVEFKKAVLRKSKLFSVMLRKAITSEEIKAMGLEKDVLMELISQKLIDFELEKMNIYVSDDRVREELYAGKNFRNKDGYFDHGMFENFLESMMYTEKEFMDDSRREIGRKLLFDSIKNGVRVAPLFSDIIYDYAFRPREVKVVKIPFESLVVSQADDQLLEKFYTQNSYEFRRPESRRVDYYVLSKENIEKLKNIEDILASGKTLKEIASEFGLKHHKLQSVDKKSLDPIAQDPAFFETVFSTNDQEDSQLFELKDGNWCGVHIAEIVPSFIPEFSKIKTEVIKLERESRQRMEAERIAREAVEHLKEKKETLKDFAKKYKQTIFEHKDVKRSGQDDKKAPFTPEILGKILEIKFGSYGFVVADNYVLVISVLRPLPVDEELKKKSFEGFSERIDDFVGNDIIQSYLSNLQKFYGVEVVK